MDWYQALPFSNIETPYLLVAASCLAAAVQLSLARYRDFGVVTFGMSGAAIFAGADPAWLIPASLVGARAWARGAKAGVTRPGLHGLLAVSAVALLSAPIPQKGLAMAGISVLLGAISAVRSAPVGAVVLQWRDIPIGGSGREN